MQQVLGYDALQIGLAFLPMTVIVGTLSLKYSEALMMKFGPKQTMVPGMTLVACSVAYFARIPVDGSYVRDILPAMILLGIGNGISFPGMMTLAMAGVKPQEAGLASGLVSSSAQVGGAVGLAVLATLAAKRTAKELASGSSMTEALTTGYHVAFVLSAGLMLVALAIAVFVIKSVKKPETRHAPLEFESVG
jgi:hypothetical protein